MGVRLIIGGSVRLFSSMEILEGRERDFGKFKVVENGHLRFDGIDFFGNFKVRKDGCGLIVEKV